MSEKEIELFIKLLEKEYKAASKRTKEEAELVLKQIGILTPSGKNAKPYKHLCTLKS